MVILYGSVVWYNCMAKYFYNFIINKSRPNLNFFVISTVYSFCSVFRKH